MISPITIKIILHSLEVRRLLRINKIIVVLVMLIVRFKLEIVPRLHPIKILNKVNKTQLLNNNSNQPPQWDSRNNLNKNLIEICPSIMINSQMSKWRVMMKNKWHNREKLDKQGNLYNSSNKLHHNNTMCYHKNLIRNSSNSNLRKEMLVCRL